MLEISIMSDLRNSESQPFLDAVKANKLGRPFSSKRVAKAFFSLTRQLTNRLTDYDLVVADDTSGRLAAIVMRGVASIVRVESGKPQPKLVFVQGHDIKYMQQAAALIPEKTSSNARTLIVTEGIATGRHVRNIGQVITPKREAASIDIASVGNYSPRLINPIPGTGLYVGDVNINDSTDEPCEQAPAQELYKGKLTHAGVTKDYYGPTATICHYTSQVEINRSRVQAEIFADLLYQAAVRGIIEPPLPYPICTPEIEKVLV